MVQRKILIKRASSLRFADFIQVKVRELTQEGEAILEWRIMDAGFEGMR